MDIRTFYYKVMLFDLKNTEATYQKIVTKVFKGLISINIEAYVKDILVKSLLFKQHLKDLEQIFAILKKYWVKPRKKCVFRMKAGKFLRFIVSKNGIESKRKKLKVLIDMNLLKTLKEVQILTGQIVALNKFVSKMVDRSLPFFKSLHNIIDFKWIEEYKQFLKTLRNIWDPFNSLLC